MSEATTHENPLINNKKLRQLYVAMLEARLFEESVAKAIGRPGQMEGEDACRISTAIELKSGDLISDARDGFVMDLVLGAKLSSVLKRATTPVADDEKVEINTASRQVWWVKDANARLCMALGAALAFKSSKQGKLVLVYVRRRDAGGSSWRKILEVSAEFALPMIFVILPDVNGRRKKRPGIGQLSTKARSCGVPAMPVDSSDAVALYRVAQESIGRARGGGGPAVIDCVASAKKKERHDPINQMKAFLLERKVCTAAWLDLADDAFRRQVAEASKLP